MNATTTGLPWSDAALTASPSWLRSVKAGSRVPGGRWAPCQPAGCGSSRALASHTPTTAPNRHRHSVVRASATRGGTRRSLGLGETAADRVADELDAVAHAELAQQVGPV